MKVKCYHFSFIFLFQFACAQVGLQFNNLNKKTTIPFEIYNNLIVVTAKINNVPLKFLLDTGVQESIIFSIDESKEVNFSKVETIQIKGYGDQLSYEGYRSTSNVLAFNDIADYNHTFYLILNQQLNISTHVGIPINGILGYHFFKDHLVKINYNTKKITVFKQNTISKKKLNKKYTEVSIDLQNNKPYLSATLNLQNENKPEDAKLLLDTGNSDAIWLLKNKFTTASLPKLTLKDYLGRGISDDVFGDRARIKNLKIANFIFNNPLVAIPEYKTIADSSITDQRSGSIGSEILKRFTLLFDYQNQKLYLKKNSSFDDAFSYNMSGLEIQHQGLQWIKQTFQDSTTPLFNVYNDEGTKDLTKNLKFRFELKPIYTISSVRENSPAHLSGLLKGDVILKINSKNSYNYKLQDINDLLKSQDGRTINFEIERNGKVLKYKIILKSII